MSVRRVSAAFAVVVAAVLAINVTLTRARATWDLTAEGSGTLSEETIRVLDSIDRRIEITAFFAQESVGRVEAATLLSRYRKANRRVTFRILDPALSPGEAGRFGISGTGSAAVQDVESPDRFEIAPYTIEIDVTSAIARLVRGVDATICFTSGHGERDVGDQDEEGLAQAARLLRENGYTVEGADLLASARVSSECDAVVVAAPTSKLDKDAIAALTGYLARQGKAFVLTDPDSAVDLSPITRDWGIEFEDGVILEGDPQSRLAGDPRAPIVRRYSGANPAVRGLGPTFFPGVTGVRVSEQDDPGIVAAEIASTSELAYLDREDVSDFDPDVDEQGPIAVGAASDASEVVEPDKPSARVLRTRVLAWGDVDFSSNAFIADAANASLWVQGIDWLTQPEDLVTAVPSFPKVRLLELTEARSRYLLFLTAGVVPGLFLIAGGMVWVVRRGL